MQPDVLLTLPTEVLELIPAGAYFKLCVGLGFPSRREILRDGGLTAILETALFNGADIKMLLQLRNHISSDIAICKAVSTRNAFILKRVCLMWDTWFSAPGYKLSCNLAFVWAVEHLETSECINMGLFYLRTGQIDRIEGKIRLNYNDINILSMIDHERLSELLSTEGLIYVLCTKGDLVGLSTEIEKDITRKIDFKFALSILIRDKFSRTAIKLYIKYGHLYWANPSGKIEKVLTIAQDVEGMKYLGLHNAEIYEAIFNMGEDKDSFNKYLRSDRQRVLDVLEQYYSQMGVVDVDFVLLTAADLDIIRANPSIELGDNARWLGLDEQSPDDAMTRLEFRYSLQDMDTKINMIRNGEITDANMVVGRRLFGGRNLHFLRALVDVCGSHVMDDIDDDKVVIVSTLDAKEDVLWFINLCADLGYEGKPKEGTNINYWKSGIMHYCERGNSDLDIALQMWYGGKGISTADSP
ncbi:hypothetical protein Unana1_03638 [Umbelopsis nana]